jgi:hypothetical protein
VWQPVCGPIDPSRRNVPVACERLLLNSPETATVVGLPKRVCPWNSPILLSRKVAELKWKNCNRGPVEQ